jgi:hypothetical protein
MAIELAEALWALEAGYCLWVGAGLTRQVAAGQAGVPLWEQITQELETAAGISAATGKDFPHRLDECLIRLGDEKFRSFLRERYYTSLCVALLSQADQLLEADDFIPDHARAVAALGQLANPIVSFNIEPLSSLLLGRPGGPIRVLVQQPKGKPVYTWREPGGRFQRLVYHPHGLATVATVMTATQYKANSQTLAFGVAIHASFGNTLVIVGMSLDDEYLRHQVALYRASIGAIYWFNSSFSREIESWAAEHDITTVAAPWGEFWQHWHQLPVELERNDLATAWYLAVNEAVEEAEGGSLGSLARSLSSHLSEVPASFRQLAEYLEQGGRTVGEPTAGQLIGGKTPRDIELALRARLMAADVRPPSISRTYDPRISASGG